MSVDALVGPDVLAQRGDVAVAEHGGVERVAALVGCGGGVGRPTVVLHVDRVDGDRLHPPQVVVGRVHHHGGVDRVEGAAADHELLAATALLGRRPQDGEGAAQRLGDGGRRQPGTESGRGDDVVAAGVADPGKGVVLAAHGDGGTVGTDAGVEGGGHVVRAPFDGEAFVVQHPGEQLVGMVLLEAQLRALVDAMRHVEQGRGEPFDLPADPLLGLGHVHGRHRSDGGGWHPGRRRGFRPRRRGRRVRSAG
jgi:hypothetical protein